MVGEPTTEKTSCEPMY